MKPGFWVLALLAPVLCHAQAIGFVTCIASSPQPTVARQGGVAELTGDLLIYCNGGTPTEAGNYIPTVNITVSLNANVESRVLGGYLTEALLLINEPQPAQQLLCSTPPLCSVIAGGNGGGDTTSPAADFNGSPGHPNIFQGVLTSNNQITFYNIPIDAPGSSILNVQPVQTLRITNVRANTLGLRAISAFVSTSAGFSIDNPTQTVSVVSGYPSIAVTNTATFPQCSAQTLQPAFTVTATEGFLLGGYLPRFASPASAESVPGYAKQSESGFLINGLPLSASSPGVADSATRIKVAFGSTPSGVTLYVPLAIGSGIVQPAGAPAQTLTATLTSSESGAFSAVAASPGTGGAMAAVTNGVAIYEVSGTQPAFAITLDPLVIPVSLSYAASAPSSFPTAGTGTVNLSYAPTVPQWPSDGNTGPIPSFIDASTPINTYTIAACGVASMTAYSGTPQIAAINTAFAAPLQVLLKDINGNPVNNSYVTFTLPTRVAGALFAGGGNVATVSSNSQGIATSPQVVANGTAGNFTASATNGVLGASFTLANVAPTALAFPAIPTHNLSESPFTVTATSNSPAPITFSIASGPATIGTTTNTLTSGGTAGAGSLTITGAGTITVQAAQAATGNFLAATATQSFLVPTSTVATFNNGFLCYASAPTPLQVRSSGIAELVGDLVLTCTGGTSAPAGTQAPSVDLTVTLNTQVESRLLNSTQSEALLLIDEPAPAAQLLCAAPTAGSSCGLSADGNGGGRGSGADYNGTAGHPNVFQGTLTSSNTITFYGVPIDPPGPAVSGVSPVLTLRITNVRANASGVPASSGFGVAPVNGTVGSSVFPIANPLQAVATIFTDLVNAVVTNPKSFSQCTAQTLQPAFTASAGEGFATVFGLRFSNPASAESTPGQTFDLTSGFLINGFPLTTASPGVADFATRVKFRFGNTPPGVTLYVPLTISALNLSQGAPTLMATLTSSEAGPFSAAQAAPGTNGLLAAVTNGAAVYEITSEQPFSQNTVETIAVPVYLSYSSTSSAGTGTVNMTLAPIVASAPANGNTGPIPAFIDASVSIPTYTITPCGSNSFTAYSGNRQSAATNTAFAAPLQILYQDNNGNPVKNAYVTFTLPASGPGAVFVGGSNVATVSTNSQGIATSPQIIANGTAGTFTASATNGSIGAGFSLTNVALTALAFAPIPTHNVGDAPFTLTATSNSPGPITFSVVSGPATVSGNALAITAAGTVTVQAAQAATANYLAATATQSFLVVGRPVASSQTITFPAIPDHNTADAPFPISATASSGLPVTFTVIAGPANINGNVVTVTGQGIVQIEADQAGNSAYLAAPAVTNNFRVFGPAPSVTSIQNGGFNSSILAPNGYGTLIGANLANQTEVFSMPPFPAQTAGLTLVLTDSAGNSQPLPLLSVSPTRIQVLVPGNTAIGPATLVVTNASARTQTLNVTIANVSPGLLAANGSGGGAFAGQASVADGQLYLTLYGNGFRSAKNLSVTVGGSPAQVLFVGAQGQFPGLDQANVMIALPASYPATVVLTADGVRSNAVTVATAGQ